MLDLAALAPDSLHPFSRADYERLVALGLFQDARVELLRGVVVSMSPQGPWHAVVTGRIHEALLRALAGQVFVMSHSQLPLGDDSEPEPDVAVYAPGAEVDALPRDPLLVVEVSDTSLAKDRELKRELYAEAGVPEYWVVSRDTIEVYREPRQGSYGSKAVFAKGEQLSLAAFPEQQIAVDAIL